MTKTMRNLFIGLVVATLATACGNAPEAPKSNAGVADSTSTPAATKPANGPQVIHTKDGGRMEGVMTNGVRTGPWTSYFPDGGIRSRLNGCVCKVLAGVFANEVRNHAARCGSITKHRGGKNLL